MKIYIRSNTQTIEDRISEILEYDDYWCYGLRTDDYDYQVGDMCFESHQLYQDPDYDEDGDLIYPYCEDGPYQGFYDAGELDGTCAIGIYNGDIERALRMARKYAGDHLYLIGGDYSEGGNDSDESIIHNAEVLLKIR